MMCTLILDHYHKEPLVNVFKTLSIAFILFSGLVSANQNTETTQQEIDHLLTFVQTTACQYERNGTVYSGVEAVEHIQKKYDYFKDDIESTEDFIKYSATKSKMSGKKYKVHCADAPAQNSSEWLLIELKRYRSGL